MVDLKKFLSMTMPNQRCAQASKSDGYNRQEMQNKTCVADFRDNFVLNSGGHFELSGGWSRPLRPLWEHPC